MPAANIAAEAPATIATLLSFGLVGFGSLALLEKFIPVIPSYVLFMLLGMTVPDGSGLGLAILVTTIGSAAGALGWFSLGWLLGPERAKAIVARYGRYVFLKPAFYERLTNSYRSNHSHRPYLPRAAGWRSAAGSARFHPGNSSWHLPVEHAVSLPWLCAARNPLRPHSCRLLGIRRLVHCRGLDHPVFQPSPKAPHQPKLGSGPDALRHRLGTDNDMRATSYHA
jgi:hypothetical protein